MMVERQTPLIIPSYSSRGISTVEFEAYIAFIEQILRNLLPQDLIIALTTKRDSEAIESTTSSFQEKLPFIAWNQPERAPCTVCISLLCHSDFTNGVGRYITDAAAKWIVPGKYLNISSDRSLDFRFIAALNQHLFFKQILLDVETDQQLSIIKRNWEPFCKQIRLNIMAVRHARKIFAIKKLSSEQKKALIEANIASALSGPWNNVENNLFSQMHNFWLSLSAEDTIQHIQEQFSPHVESRPKIFDTSIFHEIKHSILLFGDKFTALRDLNHVSRLISYQYLFRKTLMKLIHEAPGERHLRIKLIKTKISSTSRENVLGIVGTMNVLSENELFEERHITHAISHCLPCVRKVENSFVLDRKTHDPIRFFYLEIEKTSGEPFSLTEMRELAKNLPHEIYESIENVLSPVLMPRNDEEIMRNILLLSEQLKYINDLPQLIISFNAQKEATLQFIVIMLRVLRDDDLSLDEIFKASGTELKIEELETKRVGFIRKRYPKESNVFKVSVDKKKFLRRDFTIDLFKARQEVSLELNTIFNGIRDFNGGILSKQQEVYQQLKSLICENSSWNDFLLENFFYSITPPLKQTLIPPSTLKQLFQLMQEALDADYKNEDYFLKAQFEPDQLLLMAASPNPSLKEELLPLLSQLNIPPSDLSYTHVNTSGICCIGLLYHNRDPNLCTYFYSTVTNCLKEWANGCLHTSK